MKSGIQHNRVIPIFTQLLNALQFAHEKDIWHRDIKPENILIDDDGDIILADFGIAHFTETDLLTFVETKNSERLANFAYAAPEQRKVGTVVDGRSDVFSAGLILNEMFTGEIISGTDYKTIGFVNKDYAAFDEVVRKMVSQQKDERTWPVSKIAFELLTVEKEMETRKKLLELTQKPASNDNEFEEIPIPTIRGMDYSNGTLEIQLDGLDYYYSEVWFSVLRGANYSHTSPMYYGPSKLTMRSPGVLTMSVPITEAHIIKGIRQSINEWLRQATHKFNAEKTYETARKKQEKEASILAEVERLRVEERIRAELRNSL